MQHLTWRVAQRLSSELARVERFLFDSGHDRAPWLAVAFAAGISAWFALANAWQWLAMIAGLCGLALVVLGFMRVDGRFPLIRQAVIALALAGAAGCGLVWAKSELVGAPPISGPMVRIVAGQVMAREEEPAQDRVRLTIATRDRETARPIRVRINVPSRHDAEGAREGAVVRVKARLMPPAAPMLPGGYDFGRYAWFAGLAATGSALGKVELVRPSDGDAGWIAGLQRRISAHVHEEIAGSPGGIAAAFASGDRGGIALADEDAMRNSGLTHLLSISGVHVSAVIAATYFIAIRLLALWPFLALRFRLPLLSASIAALAGIAYTLLTGAEVPTVRSCLGALLVLAAIAVGREPLSLRLLAVAAFIVMLAWPEAVVGPSFQMSFAAVIAIIALHGTAPVRVFLAPRDEPWWLRALRQVTMLLLTGVVIELALMPIGLFHFHRAGVYGAFANVVAIPLTTFVSMPLIALALFLDAVGAGAPAWWLAGKSLEALLALAHWVAGQPGAVTIMPTMGQGGFVLFVAGGLWLALWRGKVRLFGLVPVVLGTAYLATLRPPDLLVSNDGRHVGITGLVADELVVLRETRSDYVRENLSEMAAMNGTVRRIDDLPGARCTRDFCAFDLDRGGRRWRLLMARGQDRVDLLALAAACERSDIVIADRRLPQACRPALLKIDCRLLDRTGGLTIDFAARRIHTVAQTEGEHGWWQGTRRSQPAWGGRPAGSAAPAQ